MTAAEAIKVLKELREWEGLPFCIEEPLGEAGVGVITEEALDMAIRSLEAWEKVRTEIKETRNFYKVNFQGYSMSVAKECLKIIDKHLKGVMECK